MSVVTTTLVALRLATISEVAWQTACLRCAPVARVSNGTGLTGVIFGEEVRQIAAATVAVLGALCLFDELSIGALSFVRLACPVMQIIAAVAPSAVIVLLAEDMGCHERTMFAFARPRFAFVARSAIIAATTSERPKAASATRPSASIAVLIVCTARLTLLFTAG